MVLLTDVYCSAIKIFSYCIAEYCNTMQCGKYFPLTIKVRVVPLRPSALIHIDAEKPAPLSCQLSLISNRDPPFMPPKRALPINRLPVGKELNPTLTAVTSGSNLAADMSLARRNDVKGRDKRYSGEGRASLSLTCWALECNAR